MICCGYPRSSWFCPECGKRLVAEGGNVHPNPEVTPDEASSRPWPNYWVQFIEHVEAANVCFEVSRLVNLPFMPVIGITIEGIFWVREEDVFDGDICEVTDVWYSLVTGRFDCWVDSGGLWDKKDVFTLEDARSWVEFGCRIDRRTDIEEWAKHQASRWGKVIPTTDPTRDPGSA